MDNIKYRFYSNKKILILTAGFFIALAAKEFSGISEPKDVLEAFITFLGAIVIANVVFYNNYASYSFESDYLNRNSLFGKSICLSDVVKVKIQQNSLCVEAVKDGQTDTQKIKTYLLENDAENARDFLKEIINSLGDNVEIDEEVLRFADGKNDILSETDYTKFSGMLGALAAGIAILVVAELIYSFTVAFILIYKPSYFFAIQAVLMAVFIIWGIIAFVSLLKKKKKSIVMIKALGIYYIVKVFADSILAYFMQKVLDGITTDLSVFVLALDVLVALFAALIAYEYLNTSKRVKATFLE